DLLQPGHGQLLPGRLTHEDQAMRERGRVALVQPRGRVQVPLDLPPRPRRRRVVVRRPVRAGVPPPCRSSASLKQSVARPVDATGQQRVNELARDSAISRDSIWLDYASCSLISSLHESPRPTFNPKVAGSIPARPIGNARKDALLEAVQPAMAAAIAETSRAT